MSKPPTQIAAVQGIEATRFPADEVIPKRFRDRLAGLPPFQMFAAEKRGLTPVATIHDEILCEAPRGEADAAVLCEAMTDLPAWAAGLPLDAVGWVGDRYRKE